MVISFFAHTYWHLCQKQILTVKEYETVRLIDSEGLIQAECVQIKNVARITVQRQDN